MLAQPKRFPDPEGPVANAMAAGRQGVAGNGGASRVWKGERRRWTTRARPVDRPHGKRLLSLHMVAEPSAKCPVVARPRKGGFDEIPGLHHPGGPVCLRPAAPAAGTGVRGHHCGRPRLGSALSPRGASRKAARRHYHQPLRLGPLGVPRADVRGGVRCRTRHPLRRHRQGPRVGPEGRRRRARGA